METKTQQSYTSTLPVTGEATTTTSTILSTIEDTSEPSTILDALNHQNLVESIKDQLRVCWQCGDEWRLEFGRLLIKFREVARHGEWIKFLETEFGLHRMTANRWMRKAAEADSIDITELEEREEVAPDEYAEELEERIADEAAERERIKKDAPRNFRMVISSVTPEEIADYKKQWKAENEWAQSILRRAFDEIRAGRELRPQDSGHFARRPLGAVARDLQIEHSAH